MWYLQSHLVWFRLRIIILLSIGSATIASIMMKPIYSESFQDGPGGWCGWISNAGGPKPLELRQHCAVSRSPWWIDYNHAPPGVGYLHLLYALLTKGPGFPEV